MFRPNLKIQTNINDTTHAKKDNRTLKDIIREKISPSELLDTSLEIADEINNISADIERQNVDFVQNNIIARNLTPMVVHARRQFDTGENTRSHYKSYIYDVNNMIIKIINYNCSPLSDYVIIKEIAAQKYAKTLSVPDKCNFETPNVFEIGRFSTSKLPESSQDIFEYNCIFFIIMNKLNYIRLKDYLQSSNFDYDEDCNQLSEEINQVIKCLEDNNLYHNDLHNENILVNTTKSKTTHVVGILDYGNASEKPFKIKQPIYNCEMLTNIKNIGSKNRMSPISISETEEININTPNQNKKRRLIGGKGGKYKKGYYTLKKQKYQKRKTIKNNKVKIILL